MNRILALPAFCMLLARCFAVEPSPLEETGPLLAALLAANQDHTFVFAENFDSNAPARQFYRKRTGGSYTSVSYTGGPAQIHLAAYSNGRLYAADARTTTAGQLGAIWVSDDLGETWSEVIAGSASGGNYRYMQACGDLIYAFKANIDASTGGTEPGVIIDPADNSITEFAGNTASTGNDVRGVSCANGILYALLGNSTNGNYLHQASATKSVSWTEAPAYSPDPLLAATPSVLAADSANIVAIGSGSDNEILSTDKDTFTLTNRGSFTNAETFTQFAYSVHYDTSLTALNGLFYLATTELVTGAACRLRVSDDGAMTWADYSTDQSLCDLPSGGEQIRSVFSDNGQLLLLLVDPETASSAAALANGPASVLISVSPDGSMFNRSEVLSFPLNMYASRVFQTGQ